MSIQRECVFIEARGAWWYVVEDVDSPRNAWDWREHAVAYGPFKSEDAADDHLSDNHSNPGGSDSITLTDEELEKDGVYKALLDNAVNPKLSRLKRRGRFF